MSITNFMNQVKKTKRTASKELTLDNKNMLMKSGKTGSTKTPALKSSAKYTS